MTTASDPTDEEIMQYVGAVLKQDVALRRELATAVRRKDHSAVARVASRILAGLKVVTPYVAMAVAAMLGIPISIGF